MALIHERLLQIINTKDKIDIPHNRMLVLVVDVQHAFTDPNNWLATTFFGNKEVSASQEMINDIWKYAGAMKNSGATVAAIKLIHDIAMMEKLDSQRLTLHRTSTPSLIEIENGVEVHKILRPGGEDSNLNFGTTGLTETDFMILKKCMRDLSRQPEIFEYIIKNNPEHIILIGIDANVCIAESIQGLLSKSLPCLKTLIVPIDLISTRPSEIDDAVKKLTELSDPRLSFILSSQLNEI